MRVAIENNTCIDVREQQRLLDVARVGPCLVGVWYPDRVIPGLCYGLLGNGDNFVKKRMQSSTTKPRSTGDMQGTWKDAGYIYRSEYRRQRQGLAGARTIWTCRLCVCVPIGSQMLVSL